MPRKTLADPRLLTYLDSLIQKLREQVVTAIKEQDASAIHQSRVTTRRLAAMLEVLKPVLSKARRNEMGNTLRKLRRRLGPLRDLDVMIGHLAEVKTERLGPATDWMRSNLGKQRDDLRQSASDKVDPPKVLAKLGAWWNVRQEILAAREAIDSLLAESLHLQLDSFIDHADGATGRRVDFESDMKDPHELRIAGKALRYTLEMAIANGHKLPAAVTRSFKKMQDALGLWHDYVVLAECVMSVSLDELLAHHDAPLQSHLLDVAKVYLHKSSRAMTHFGEIWKERGDEVTRTIRNAFPLTMPVEELAVTESQTDHDHVGSEKSPDDLAGASPTEISPA